MNITADEQFSEKNCDSVLQLREAAKSTNSNLANGSDYENTVMKMLPEIRNSVHLVCLPHKHKADREEINDICQQIVLLLIEDDHRRLRLFKQRSSIETWLRTVVKNHVGRHLRRQKQWQRAEKLSMELFLSHIALEKEILSKERRGILQSVVPKLNRRERQLFDLLCEDDLNLSDIANLLDVKAGTLRKRKHDLIEKLRKLVESR